MGVSKTHKPHNKTNSKPAARQGEQTAGKPKSAGADAGKSGVATKQAPAPSKGKENEAQIAVHWKEEEYFHPTPKFIGQANLNDPAMVERFSEKNFPESFRDYAELLDWDKYWHTTLDTSNPPFWKWFVGGKLNACYNCVDRHLT